MFFLFQYFEFLIVPSAEPFPFIWAVGREETVLIMEGVKIFRLFFLEFVEGG
jgi:hypothetical protein